MQSTHTYFRKHPRVILLDVLAAESIIAPFIEPRSLRVILSNDLQLIRSRVDEWVEQAQTELIATCNAFDFGLSLLTAEPYIVDELITKCYRTGFPYGQKALHQLLHLGSAIPDLPASALSVQNIHVQTIVMLHHLARGHTMNRLEMLRADTLWTQDDWDAYFQEFPNDEFRIPVVAAAQALYKRKPEAFHGSLYRLFARHFQPSRNPLFEKQSWQEADQQQRDEGSVGY